MKYWITVASKDHIDNGIKGGFMQACHGKVNPLKKMSVGDYVIFYSPKTEFDGNEKCQSFTAIGKVKDEQIYQYQMSENFIPFRRNIDFIESDSLPIQPLINDLEFIKNKKSWGFVFRFGFFEINEHDFKLISEKMLNHALV